MTKRKDEDSPWKTILRGYFPAAIEFFFPDIAKLIDWQIPPVFLDKEFQQISPDAEVGKRYADQLVKVKLKRGKSLILLVHIEIQARKEQDFELRMLVYAMRIFDRFKQLPSSLAILCDTNAEWRPNNHILTAPGSMLDFNFTGIKLLDYKKQWIELESSLNPFAVVVMAQLKSQELKNKAKERKIWKFILVRSLYEKGYNKSQVVDLFKFIDWILVLPEGLTTSFWNDLKAYEAEKTMPYITSVQKLGIKEGEENMVLKMLQKGMSVEDVASIADLSIEQVHKIQAKQQELTDSKS
jgi:predicted transposase/invertase (TIGR01784 family)